ncbi:MAG: outer membrane lipoprotein-sorting protein [Myxococcota bacterium]
MKRLAGRLLLLWFLGAALPAPFVRAELEPAPDGLDATEIARRSEDTLRSDRTYLAGHMIVSSPRLAAPRRMAFRSWDDRPGKRALIRIDEPAKDRGTGFLKLHPNMWMYIPRVERTMRIPPSMMLQSWMGSDFTNDDLVRESSQIDDYEHRLLGIDPSPPGSPGRPAYVVEYIPHEDAAVVWGRIVVWSDAESGTPLLHEFYDEDGTKLRVLRFDDIRDVDGRRVPHRWSLQPLDKQGHETVIEIDVIRFDVKFDEQIFTTRNLKRGK